ncbi:hypothetical protein PI125_g15067 [Phytophthora idaei]|nr:hypothetical protein PI125_g15067 [Phytophthora idaei]KAG3137592.1 hypothetical protein PI126_g17323 [Phytophthora idaei]
MKSALLFQHLSGAASQWGISEFDDLRDRSLSSLGRALKREFGIKLSKAQIGQMVANERKKATETYREYSLRLRDMAASATWNGFKTVESNNLALSSFITNAWRKHSDNLHMVIREDTRYPVHEMDRVVSKLCTISGRQGSLTFPQHQPAQMKSAVADARSSQSKRKATEETGRNENIFKRRDYSTARCGTCGEIRHTTGYHDRFVAL